MNRTEQIEKMIKLFKKPSLFFKWVGYENYTTLASIYQKRNIKARPNVAYTKLLEMAKTLSKVDC